MSNQPNPAMPRNEQQPASSAEPPDLYRIEQVAELTGLTKRTLRYYEERGLLDPPTRTEGNYRLYTAADVDHIRRVKRIRELLGASLAEIKEMVEGEEARQSFRDEWALNPDPATRVALLERGAAVVDRQLAVVRENGRPARVGGNPRLQAAPLQRASRRSRCANRAARLI
jgi:MerR family transcriptional regulator, repressor of the yfmOP operon